MTYVKCFDRPSHNGLFDPFFVNEFRNQFMSEKEFKPATNIYENQEAFMIEMVVPGMNKEDFNISLEKEMLSVSSEKEIKNDENIKFTRRDFSIGKFSRSFIVPKTVNVEEIVADYEAGILKLTLPKKEDAKVEMNRSISVN